MSTESERAHERLIEGMIDRTPGCLGIDAFTADHLTRDDVDLLQPICAACDLQLLCRRFVELERPKVGYWAGRYYGPKNRPKAEAA